MSKPSKKAILMEFAKKVRLRRHELGLSQEQLAEKSHCHVNYIGGIERAARNASLEKIVYIARALEISPKTLMPD